MKPLHEIMDAWEDGNLSPDDLPQLKAFLRDPEARSQIRDEICFLGLLNEVLSTAAPETQVELEPQQGFGKRLAARLPASIIRWVSEAFRSRPAVAWGSIAIILLAGFVIWYARPHAIGYVSQSGDGVLITHAGKNDHARPGSKIYAGDFVTTPEFASGAFHWKNEPTEFYLATGTKIQVNQVSRGKELSLSNGVLKAVVARQSPKLPLIINSPAAVTRVVGTRFTLSASTKGDRLEVVDGSVEFTDRQQQSLTLHAGESVWAAPGVPFEVKQVNGAVWWEVWVAGANALSSDIPQPSTIVYEDYLGGAYTLVWSYPFISDWSKHYHERARGFIIPEQTGDYTFWMMSRGASELWLSKDSSPSNKVMIASSPAPAPGAPLTQTWNWVLQPGTDQTTVQNVPWNKFPSQKSAPQRLIAGQRYYFEALHELVYEDCIAVVWSKPDQDFPAETVPGRVLSPFRK